MAIAFFWLQNAFWPALPLAGAASGFLKPISALDPALGCKTPRSPGLACRQRIPLPLRAEQFWSGEEWTGESHRLQFFLVLAHSFHVVAIFFPVLAALNLTRPAKLEDIPT